MEELVVNGWVKGGLKGSEYMSVGNVQMNGGWVGGQ